VSQLVIGVPGQSAPRGHGLGLAHTSVSGATMFPSVSFCNNGPASIAADDRAAVNDLY
jgi:hypothetical protein